MNFTIAKLKVIILSILIFLLSFHTIAQNSFVKKISNTYGSSGSCGIQTLDKGFVVVGNISDSVGVDVSNNKVITSDILIVKYAYNGDSLWSRKIGGINNEYGLKIKETTDSCLYILGTDSLNNGLLLKLNQKGQLLWSKNYLNKYLQNIIIKQNNLYLFGETNYTTSSVVNVEILKCDTSGAIITQKTYGVSSSNDFFVSTDTISANGFVILGKTTTTSVLYKLNSQLDTLWTKTYFNSNYRPVKIVSVDDTTAIILYSYGTLPVQNIQPRAIKVSLNNGAIKWQQNYFDNQNYDVVTDMLAYNSDETLICGILNNNLIGDSNQMFVQLIDKYGNEIYLNKKNMFDTLYLSIASMNITSDNGLLLTGTKDNCLFLYKTSNNFTPVFINDVKNASKNIIPFPNPVKDDLNINISMEELPAKLLIYDINGKLYLRSNLNNINNHIDVSFLKTGIYFYEIFGKKTIFKGKILKI